MIEQILVTVNDWLRNWELLSQEMRVGILIFSILTVTAVIAFVLSRSNLALEKRVVRTTNIWDDAFLHAVRKPLLAFLWLQGVFWAAEVAHYYSEAEIFSANSTMLRIGGIWVGVWTIWGLIKQVEKTVLSPLRVAKPMDYTTVNAVSKLSRAVVIITAVLIVMQSLGYSISGVLAFGGVGGIAVGFAAKDLLANFFGGFIIHMDRPFKVGDWVRSPDREIEGTVEHIGWRLTTVRTFDKRPLYVPNAAFTTIAVENPSRMTNRRIFEKIGIRYADVNQVGSIVTDIRTMLENHEDIDAEQTLIVNFLAFNESSLDIMVYTFTKTRDWVEYHRVKQDVLLAISDVIEGYEAEVAFPTRTLYLNEQSRLPRETEEKKATEVENTEQTKRDPDADDSGDPEARERAEVAESEYEETSDSSRKRTGKPTPGDEGEAQ